MERKSEYFAGLSVDSQRRYEKKFVANGLSTDPYAASYDHMMGTPLIKCNCCGKGVFEVKRPFCIKEGLPDDPDETDFSLMKQDEFYES